MIHTGQSVAANYLYSLKPLMGTAIKHPVPDQVKPSFAIFTSGHSDSQPGASKLRDECQSAQMSKITNDGLTWSGTGCFTAN